MILKILTDTIFVPLWHHRTKLVCWSENDELVDKMSVLYRNVDDKLGNNISQSTLQLLFNDKLRSIWSYCRPHIERAQHTNNLVLPKQSARIYDSRLALWTRHSCKATRSVTRWEEHMKTQTTWLLGRAIGCLPGLCQADTQTRSHRWVCGAGLIGAPKCH